MSIIRVLLWCVWAGLAACFAVEIICTIAMLYYDQYSKCACFGVLSVLFYMILRDFNPSKY